MIRYQIDFLSEWHIGSGLGAGAESDATILVDKNKMPFIPGKTIKGLLRDAMQDIRDVKDSFISDNDFQKVFGIKTTERGIANFSNCTLEESEYKAVVYNELQDYLLKNVASTSIDSHGVANDQSLRSKEVCIPMTLCGQIDNADEYKDKIETAFKWLRGAGVNRNRGLGRCKITIKDK